MLILLPTNARELTQALQYSQTIQPTKVNQANNFKAPKCDHKPPPASRSSYMYSTNKSKQLKQSSYQVQSGKRKDAKLIARRAWQACDHCSCKQRHQRSLSVSSLLPVALLLAISGVFRQASGQLLANSSLDQQSFSGAQLLPTVGLQLPQTAAALQQLTPIGAHLQPSYVYGARNRSINFTHMAVDELTGSIYLGATNWLFQLSVADLQAKYVLKTGPASENSRDCAPADCAVQIGHIDAHSLPMHHAHGPDMSVPNGLPMAGSGSRRTMHTIPLNGSAHNNLAAAAAKQASGSSQRGASQLPAYSSNSNNNNNNNYNKILAIDLESRQLIVCGSLNQGACRRHQLGQLANFSELIPLPVASNDEHSSNVALITSTSNHQRAGNHQQRPSAPPIMYVAATNSRLGPYREMVPAISARYLEPPSRAMQIIERSFTDSARIDVSFELRDYYLVNYIYTFQHNDYVYFATVQRKSPLRQLEEWGYITRLARLCLSDLSFQSYTEITLECEQASSGSAAAPKMGRSAGGQQRAGSINYNLLQDAQLTSASSQLAQQLGVRQQQPQAAAVLVAAFAQSKDHTTKSQQKSAICLYSMDKIEQKFTDNINLCYNGTAKARNMNYIAGSVNDCPKSGAAGMVTNFCSEPLKLNGSSPLHATPVISYENELITSVASTHANTSPINMKAGELQQQQNAGRRQYQHTQQSQRQHQVLVAGTSDGALKRIVLVAESEGAIKGLEFDSVQLDAEQAILADLHLWPANNPQLLHTWHGGIEASATNGGSVAQFALAATSFKVAKLRINACKLTKFSNSSSQFGNQSAADACNQCAQLQDPFCGWCSTSGSCSTRDECLSAASAQHAAPVHWSPFDQVRCADYQPVAPQFVALQAAGQQPIDVNIRIDRDQQLALAEHNGISSSPLSAMAVQLAQTQFLCHFDYLALANRSSPMPRLTGATTKATQARLNLHTATVAIGCPLPPPSQRPPGPLAEPNGELRVKLSARPAPTMLSSPEASGASLMLQQLSKQLTSGGEIEREISLYDCSIHTNCRTCLGGSGSQQRAGRRWHCAWCPLSSRCTFNASHPDFGCAATAIISTTPHSTAVASVVVPSSSSNSVRPSHLAPSLDQAQANVFGLSLDKLSQCPAMDEAGSEQEPIGADNKLGPNKQPQQANRKYSKSEILVPNNSRRSLQISLSPQAATASLMSGHSSGGGHAKRAPKLECQLEVEGARARVGARWLPAGSTPETASGQVVCQEMHFSYLDEVATLRSQLYVILNDNQVIDMTDVILYKCHLFGVSPPALTSTIGLFGANQQQPSSAAWRAHDLLQPQTSSSRQASNLFRRQAQAGSSSSSADCSLCLNVERKYQCAWCANQCQHADQCTDLQASTCPPPRIDSIHPTSGPLEGGTLLTIEGSNLGSNEREIQDKITVGGEPCSLVMYSVSTRIVCKTGPSQHGPQASTVFVGNRAGVTSAYEKFHYKPNRRSLLISANISCPILFYGDCKPLSYSDDAASCSKATSVVDLTKQRQQDMSELQLVVQAVHLTDVHPRIGPVSGGTRLYLSGSNLNVGSRIQIFLDEIPCSLDSISSDPISSQQITCITAPHLVAASMRITRLTLMIDNSTHHLPFPFTYQPDPIITNIEPAESFVSGGRLILITGQHLASPQSTKLMLYHEHKHNIINGTSCTTQNDTLIICLTPGLSRDMLAGLYTSSTDQPSQVESGGSGANNDIQHHPDSLSYESGGLKLKISLFMDDVRSVRNLDEYYHHLPHYITYYEDPQFFRLANPMVEHSDELVIAGENLQMRHLDQDMLITIGFHTCPIKSIAANRVVCLPPKKIRPVYDELGRHMDRAMLPIVVLVGSNLRYQVGHMQYSSYQYDPLLGVGHTLMNSELTPQTSVTSAIAATTNYPSSSGFESNFSLSANGVASSPSVAILLLLSVIGFIIGFAATFMFAMSRIRRSKAEREYKRIQLQMGSLDVNGQPINGALFDNHHHGQPNQGVRARALDYVGGALSGKKLFYQFNQQLPSFPPSPLTDISSLTGSGGPNQHVVKLSSNGTIINSTNHPNQQQSQYHHYQSGSSQSSPGSSTRTTSACVVGNQASGVSSAYGLPNQPQLIQSLDKSCSPLNSRLHQANGSSRNFSWTQKAPSTIVPYSVIETCKLSLDKVKDYV